MRSLLILAGGVALAAPPAIAQPIRLDPVILSANRAATDPALTGASVSVLDAQALEADGRPFALQQITDLPGVTVQQNGPAGAVSGFAVRGAPQSYVRVEVDGIEISDPTGPQVSPSLSGFLVDDASRIEVLKGSQSALYGGQAVGGVVAITTPRPTEPGIGSRLLLEGGSFSTLRGAYTLTGLGPRGEFALTAARLRTDGFSAADEADGAREADGYDTTRLSGSGRLALSDQATLFGSAFWQDEDGDYDEPGFAGLIDTPSAFETTSWGLRGGVEFNADGGLASTLSASWYDVDRRFDSVNPDFGDSTFDGDGDRARIEYLGEVAVTDTLGLQFGADYARETARSVSVGAFGTERVDASDWIAGGFAQAAWTPSDALAVTGAARLDEHSAFGAFPTGRLTVAYLPVPDVTLRGSLGSGFRAPSLYELYGPYGNDRLDPETSLSADLGVARRFAEGRGEASATLFWLRIEDLIDFDGATLRYVQSDGTAASRGAELAGRYAVADWLTLRAAYTYTDAEGANGRARDRIPRHDLALAASGAIGSRVSYDVNASVVRDLLDRTGAPSEGFARDYVVVNARLAYALTDTAEVFVRAENLFDEQYQTARGYAASDRAVYAGVAARF